MRFETWSKGIATVAVDCLVVGIFEEGELGEEARAVDSACGGRLKKLLARGDFPGKPAETLLLSDLPGIAATRVLLTGLGAKKSFGRKTWRKAWTDTMSAVNAPPCPRLPAIAIPTAEIPTSPESLAIALLIADARPASLSSASARTTAVIGATMTASPIANTSRPGSRSVT